MNLENRITDLEAKIGGGEQQPPLILIEAVDCSKGAQEPAHPVIAVIPGIRKRAGIELTKGENETDEAFTVRAREAYDKFYA